MAPRNQRIDRRSGARRSLLLSRAATWKASTQFIGAGNPTGTQLIWVPQVTDPAAITKYASVGLHPGDPFPNNTIPAGLIDSNAAAYLKAGYFPTPNQSDGLYYYKAAHHNRLRS